MNQRHLLQLNDSNTTFGFPCNYTTSADDGTTMAPSSESSSEPTMRPSSEPTSLPTAAPTHDDCIHVVVISDYHYEDVSWRLDAIATQSGDSLSSDMNYCDFCFASEDLIGGICDSLFGNDTVLHWLDLLVARQLYHCKQAGGWKKLPMDFPCININVPSFLLVLFWMEYYESICKY